MPDRLPDSWRHELALLKEELNALDHDIAGARAASERARHGPFGHEEPHHAHVYGETVELADGAEVVIRPIEPEDETELRRGLEHLSALTAFRRFHAHRADADPEEWEDLTRIDHVRHEALAALDPKEGSVVGVARYVCDPKQPSQAEITYVVDDEWQHRGVGSALIDRIAVRAREAGVERFIATSLAVDKHAQSLLLRVADPVAHHDHDGILETTARLRP